MFSEHAQENLSKKQINKQTKPIKSNATKHISIDYLQKLDLKSGISFPHHFM